MVTDNLSHLANKKPGLHCCNRVQPDAGIVANSAQAMDFRIKEIFRDGHRAALPHLSVESLGL